MTAPRRCPPPLLALAVLLMVTVTACGSVPSKNPADASTASRTKNTTSSSTASSSAETGAPDSSASETCTPEKAIARIPLRKRLAQLLVIGVGAGSAKEALSVVRGEQVGGIFLTGDATALLSGDGMRRVKQAASIPLMVAVDDEGGRVQRIEALVGSIPSAREMADTMTPHKVYELALRRGKALASYGVTTDFAPLLDVSSKPDNTAIGDRSFSDDPAEVAEYASAFARGLRDAGIQPTFKHFPGQGHAQGDSHKGTATTPPLSQLRKVDLAPYRKLLGGESQAAVMVGHLNVPGLTEPDVPASISPAAMSLLRDDLGFDGLIVTDDLYAMDAISNHYGPGEAARRAIAAGADMALLVSSQGLDSVLDTLEKAVDTGSLPESRVNDAVAHVLRAKHVAPCDLP